MEPEGQEHILAFCVGIVKPYYSTQLAVAYEMSESTSVVNFHCESLIFHTCALTGTQFAVPVHLICVYMLLHEFRSTVYFPHAWRA